MSFNENSFDNSINNSLNYNQLPVSSFDPLTHIPPKYDIYGYAKPPNQNNRYNILAEKDQIKIPWEEGLKSRNNILTRSELIERRKQERMPSLTYDLDNDGYVSQKDYIISRLYDSNKDGILAPEERKKALEDLKNNNVDKNYLWNLDYNNKDKGFRVIQKSGKIIENENFSPLHRSYPKHPLSNIVPKNGIKTLTELKEYRTERTKTEINEKILNWEKQHPQKLISETLPVDIRIKPKYTSMKDLKNKYHRESRKKVGLLEFEQDIKITDKDPSLEYVDNPKHKTLEDILFDRHLENIEKSKILNLKHHKNDTERLKEREDEVFASLYKKEDGMTYRKLQDKKRKELFEYNEKTFSNHPIGVHGHELPKFSENEAKKEFWKFREGYCENPKFKSQVELLENNKFWKKPEELLLSEHRDNEYVSDKRRFNIPKKEEKELITNLNEVNFYNDYDPAHPTPINLEIANKKYISRWSTLVNMFSPKNFGGGRFFDSLPKDKDEEHEERRMKVINEQNNIKKLFEDKKIEDNERVEEVYEQPQKNSLFRKFSAHGGLKINKSVVSRTKAFE